VGELRSPPPNSPFSLAELLRSGKATFSANPELVMFSRICAMTKSSRHCEACEAGRGNPFRITCVRGLPRRGVYPAGAARRGAGLLAMTERAISLQDAAE
jgi:hypothetical protein